LLQRVVKLFELSSDVGAVEVEAQEGQSQNDKIEYPEDDKKVGLRSLYFDVADECVADFELVVNADFCAFVIMVYDAMDVLLEEAVVFYLEVVNLY
jgi:hypothetical protein